MTKAKSITIMPASEATEVPDAVAGKSLWEPAKPDKQPKEVLTIRVVANGFVITQRDIHYHNSRGDYSLSTRVFTTFDHALDYARAYFSASGKF